MKKIYRKILKLSLLVFGLCSGIYFFQPLFVDILAKIQHIPPFEALLYTSLIYILGNLLILPIGLPISLLAGILWGTFQGGLLINIMATFVAALSFLIARQFATDFTDSLFKRFTLLRRFKETIQHCDWQFVALMRINPVIPFSLSNYAFGLIPDLSFRTYLIATLLANLLPSFFFAGVGATFKTITLQNTSLQEVILNIGIVILLFTTLLMLKMIKLQPPLTTSKGTLHVTHKP